MGNSERLQVILNACQKYNLPFGDLLNINSKHKYPLKTYLPVCCIYQSIYLYINLSVYLSIYLSVCLSVCLCVCLSICICTVVTIPTFIVGGVPRRDKKVHLEKRDHPAFLKI